MPMVLKTPKTFYLAKPKTRYYRIHTSIPACPWTHTRTPLRYACGSSGSQAAPPPPPNSAANTPPPASFDR